MLVSISN